uniref:Uncharacterized protein n=1 Tax=Tanacetum cinerariifolium TaxID=118510 RepID=A0A6L2MXY9_TANCI|nr:hypothetical protein [Tanacetum cinerariifolium]
MLTHQDIYAAGFKKHPPMLNKDNYVPWSSRLICYAKSKPNGKLIYNSNVNGPYVRRMIPEPGDPDREVPVIETNHEQTDDELTGNEVKQMEADDQAIQIILMGLPEDIYVAVNSCETAQEIWLHVQEMRKGGLNKIEKVNANCILMANLQQHQHQEATKIVRDFKSLAKEVDESLIKHKALEFEIERLLRAIVSQDSMSIAQSNFVVDTLNLQTELDRIKEKLENSINKKEKEYVVLWNNWYTKCGE